MTTQIFKATDFISIRNRQGSFQLLSDRIRRKINGVFHYGYLANINGACRFVFETNIGV
jgi:hypothetical protein